MLPKKAKFVLLFEIVKPRKNVDQIFRKSSFTRMGWFAPLFCTEEKYCCILFIFYVDLRCLSVPASKTALEGIYFVFYPVFNLFFKTFSLEVCNFFSSGWIVCMPEFPMVLRTRKLKFWNAVTSIGQLSYCINFRKLVCLKNWGCKLFSCYFYTFLRKQVLYHRLLSIHFWSVQNSRLCLYSNFVSTLVFLQKNVQRLSRSCKNICTLTVF